MHIIVTWLYVSKWFVHKAFDLNVPVTGLTPRGPEQRTKSLVFSLK